VQIVRANADVGHGQAWLLTVDRSPFPMVARSGQIHVMSSDLIRIAEV
jgi:hypothetical protein